MKLNKPELKIVDVEPGSARWLRWRDTVVGASDGYRAMGMSKSLYDIYAGLKKRPTFNGNEATETGHRREADVRFDYELDECVDLQQLCGQRGFIASSSDGTNITGDEQSEPEVRMAIEVKSPTDPDVHERYIGGTIGDIGDTHYHQCQQTIYVFDLAYIDFISYKPDLEGDLTKKYILRVWPNDEYIEDMVLKLSEFWERVQTQQWPDEEKSALALSKQIASPSAPAMVSTGVPFALAQRVGDLVATADMEVSTRQSSEDAADLIKNMRHIGRKLEETRLEITKPHRDYCTEVKSKFDSVTDELTKASKALTGKLHTFNEEQERIRQEEIRQQQEELRKQQEEEQRLLREAQEKREKEERLAREAQEKRENEERLAAEAETRRLEEEAAAAQSEKDAKAAEKRLKQAREEAEEAEAERKRQDEADAADRKARDEEERLRLEKQAKGDAEKLEQRGQKTNKTRGLSSTASSRGQMNFEIVDFSKVPDEYKQLDEGAVRKAIRRSKDRVSEIEGLKIFETKKTVVR